MEKRKKLLIIGPTNGCYGGLEAFMITLAQNAANWPEYEVRLCFKLVKIKEPEADLKRMAEGGTYKVYYVQRASIGLVKLIAWADILHVQNPPPDIVFVAKLMAKKIFLTVHNRLVPVLSFHNILWKISIRLAYRRWFNSNYVWASWEKGVKAENSSCVPTVCNLPKGWYPPAERKGFLFVGRWIPKKGIQEIVKAYALTGLNPKDWPLTILGDGPLRTEIILLVKQLGLTEINMPGFIDEQAKATYISSARWLLAPALTNEDLGLTPIEARSVGVPSIVTQDGGLPEAGGPAALIAKRGDVEDLAKCMMLAVNMDEETYIRRGQLAMSSLKDFLKPMSFYREAYVA